MKNTISTNPVQQSIYENNLAPILDGSEDCYDYANAIAALQKFTGELIEGYKHHYPEQNVTVMIGHAMKDWVLEKVPPKINSVDGRLITYLAWVLNSPHYHMVDAIDSTKFTFESLLPGNIPNHENEINQFTLGVTSDGSIYLDFENNGNNEDIRSLEHFTSLLVDESVTGEFHYDEGGKAARKLPKEPSGPSFPSKIRTDNRPFGGIPKDGAYIVTAGTEECIVKIKEDKVEVILPWGHHHIIPSELDLTLPEWMEDASLVLKDFTEL